MTRTPEERLAQLEDAERGRGEPPSVVKAELWDRIAARLDGPSDRDRLPRYWPRLILLLLLLLAGIVGAVTMFTDDGPSERGAVDDPGRVLLVDVDAATAARLEAFGFTVTALSYPDAVERGQELDSGLVGIRAILEYADEHGFGYVGLRLGLETRASLARDALDDRPPRRVPEEASFAVLSVGDVGIRHDAPIRAKSFGERAYVPSWTATYGEAREGDDGEMVALVEALFLQYVVGRTAAGDLPNTLEAAALARRFVAVDVHRRLHELGLVPSDLFDGAGLRTGSF